MPRNDENLGCFEIKPSEPGRTVYCRADRPVFLLLYVTGKGRTYIGFDVEDGRRYRIGCREEGESFVRLDRRLNAYGTELQIHVGTGPTVPVLFCGDLQKV